METTVSTQFTVLRFRVKSSQEVGDRSSYPYCVDGGPSSKNAMRVQLKEARAYAESLWERVKSRHLGLRLLIQI